MEQITVSSTGISGVVGGSVGVRSGCAVSKAESAMLRAEIVRLRVVLGKRIALYLWKHQELKARLGAVEDLLLFELGEIRNGIWAQDPLQNCLAGRHALVARARLALVSEVAVVLCRRCFTGNAHRTFRTPAAKAAGMPSKKIVFARRAAENLAGAICFPTVHEARPVLLVARVAIRTILCRRATWAAHPAGPLCVGGATGTPCSQADIAYGAARSVRVDVRLVAFAAEA